MKKVNLLYTNTLKIFFLVLLVLIVCIFIFSLRKLTLSKTEPQPKSAQDSTITLEQGISNVEQENNSQAVTYLPTAPDSWSTYKSIKFNYMIKFPPDWAAIETGDDELAEAHILLTSVKPPVPVGKEPPFTVQLDIYRNSQMQTPLEWVTENNGVTLQSKDFTQIARREKTLGIETSALPSQMGALTTIFSHKEYLYTLSLIPYDPNEPQIAQRTVGAVEIFHLISGSLQFID